MKKLLTIIIPAYNVQEYISQGLDSLIVIEEILEDIEILVINDGSLDKTKEIVENYASKYSGIIRLINQENMGHGGAVNSGIKEARGFFFRVLDGDDWVNSEGLIHQIRYMNKHVDELSTIDAIINPSETVYIQEKERKEIKRRLPYESGTLISLRELNDLGYYWDITRVTYRSDIYKKMVDTLFETKVSYDDMEYVIYPLPYIRNVLYLDDIIVEYRYGTASQSMALSNRQKNLWMQEKILNKCINYYRRFQNSVSNDQEQSMFIYICNQISVTANICFSLPNYEEGKRRIKRLICEYKEFPMNKISNKKLKIMELTKFRGYSFVSFLYRKFKLGL